MLPDTCIQKDYKTSAAAWVFANETLPAPKYIMIWGLVSNPF